jgi:anti-sigma B factor antagonist
VTEQITVEVTTVGGHAVVAASGEIDMSSAPILRAAIDTMIENGTRQLIVDLGGVWFMDSTGLNLLIAVGRELGTGSLGVVTNHPNVRRVFTISGVDMLIPIFDSIDAAVEAASNPAPG